MEKLWGLKKAKKGDTLGLVERIYNEKIDGVVGHPVWKWVIIAISVIWFALAIYFTSQVKPLSE